MNQDSDNPDVYGLLGKNISYSLSPSMHNTAFKYFKINAEYKIFDLALDQLETFVRTELLSGKVSGVNVTVPYKIKMKEILESCGNNRLDDITKRVGALNTIRVDGTILSAWNTDTFGFSESIKEDLEFDPEGKKVVVLGAGGAGRAISLYFAFLKDPKRISVYDIDSSRLDSIRNTYEKWTGNTNPELLDYVTTREELSLAISDCDLLINATPIGTKDGDVIPIDISLLNDSSSVYDLVYARETELVKCARDKGLKAANGEGMLANQGAKAFYYWNEDILSIKDPEIKITKKIMREVLLKKLGRS